MNDEIDNRIKKEGNVWLYTIITIIMLLLIVNKCNKTKTDTSNSVKTEISK